MTTARVAYFSMETALDPSMPTYAGGLGVLAGDTLRSAADLAIPMVAVTLLHRRGYFDQRLDARGDRYAIGIPGAEVWDAHQEAKRALIHHVNGHSDTRLDESVLTIGFARRATAYKRATLLFHDLGRLQALAADSGPIQVVFAGKAHPRDDEGKEMIRRVHEARKALGDRLAVTYLANYDMALARLVCAGVDVWLNTPLPPLEASGTSGMKAAVNGVPSLSVLDGWWIEGHIEGVTGWAIGEPRGTASEAPARAADIDAHHAAALYDKLATSVLSCFYAERERFIDIMRHAIALNGSFFNSQRMVWQYLHNAYQV